MFHKVPVYIYYIFIKKILSFIFFIVASSLKGVLYNFLEKIKKKTIVKVFGRQIIP